MRLFACAFLDVTAQWLWDAAVADLLSELGPIPEAVTGQSRQQVGSRTAVGRRAAGKSRDCCARSTTSSWSRSPTSTNRSTTTRPICWS